jgi:Arc/MetJ-type ribon-helix-helix transcriptional regulator
MSPQIAVRVDQRLVEQLEELVAEGRFETKADAIRTAIEALVDVERRRKIGEAIVEGYRRIPQDIDPDLEATLDHHLHDLLADLEAEEGDRPW